MLSGYELVEGVVVDTADPQEMGRMKVWIPAIDGGSLKTDASDIAVLPWVTYVTPLAGHAHEYQAGGTGGQPNGPVAYGFWAVPKIGAKVIIGFLYGDFNQRVYMGSILRDHSNRSLPVGRNSEAAPQSDSSGEIEPQATNLKAQFQGDLANPIARSRGAYERQVAQAATEKDDTEGYQPRATTADPEDGVGTLDPQTYCITTPGRHSIIMQDNPKNARLRLKTAEGHQVIFDDANERIYISVARGNTWIELDADGHVHLYAAETISMSAGGDFNLQALGNVRISAGKNVDINAAGYLRGSACQDLSLSGKGVNITSTGAMNFLAAGELLQTGSAIHLNGPKAAEAPCATGPEIVPSHEPWTRPSSKGPRGPNWKP